MSTHSVVSNSITDGPLWKGLLRFFFPLVFGAFFQQLYNTVDAIVVGQFVGKEALAAAGGGSAVYANLLIGFFMGVSSGATIIVAQYFGAARNVRLSRTIHTAVALAACAGIVFSVLGAWLAPFSMRIIGTPESVFAGSVLYLRIFFIGMLPMFVYNMCAGIMQALGDSKTPFYILVVGCGANIVLDLLFVAVVKGGVAGAAWATVLSQTFCMVLSLLKLHRLPAAYRLSVQKLRFTPSELSRTVRLGLPAGIQSSLYAVSNLIIQGYINSFDTDVVAAWAVYMRVDGLFWMAVSSFGVAMTTCVGQNYGAGKIERVFRATREGLWMMSAVAVISTLVLWFFGQYIFLLFTSDAAVISAGMHLLKFLVPFLITYIPIEVLSGTIRGSGETFKPMIITLLGICALRIIWLVAAVPFWHTIRMVAASYPVTWIVTSVAFFIYYARRTWLHEPGGRAHLDGRLSSPAEQPEQ